MVMSVNNGHDTHIVMPCVRQVYKNIHKLDQVIGLLVRLHCTLHLTQIVPGPISFLLCEILCVLTVLGVLIL